MEVLALVVTGLLNKQIAAKLRTTEFTVKVQTTESHAKDAGRIFGRVGSNGRKVGHSYTQGLVDLY
jgi:FixJ family two-component response regulator